MKARGKKKAKKRTKYTTVTVTMPREHLTALQTVAQFSDRSVEDVMNVLLGVAMYMGRATTVAVSPLAPQVAPDGEPPAPAPVSPDHEGAAPVT